MRVSFGAQNPTDLVIEEVRHFLNKKWRLEILSISRKIYFTKI